jgi:F0F1-type ATP synthase membrane subunit b/b'
MGKTKCIPPQSTITLFVMSINFLIFAMFLLFYYWNGTVSPLENYIKSNAKKNHQLKSDAKLNYSFSINYG